jgi:hypothetical protein
MEIYIAYVYLHAGQLLFADQKYLLLKRITVQSRKKLRHVIVEVKGPFCRAPTLLLLRKPCKHRTTMHHPPALPSPP